MEFRLIYEGPLHGQGAKSGHKWEIRRALHPQLQRLWRERPLKDAASSLLAHPALLWGVTVFYGLVAGLGEGAERALVSDFAGNAERGTAFGWYHLMLGLAAIPGGALFGAVWHFAGAAWAFSYAGILGLAAAALMRLWVPPRPVV